MPLIKVQNLFNGHGKPDVEQTVHPSGSPLISHLKKCIVEGIGEEERGRIIEWKAEAQDRGDPHHWGSVSFS